MVARLLLAAALFSATPALAQRTINGTGRITVMGGMRWLPNWYFLDKAATVDHAAISAPGIGPQGAASFGYGFTDYLEASIELGAAYETFSLKDYAPFTSSTLMAQIGLRLTKIDFPFRGLMPHLSVLAGPTLATVTSPSLTEGERSLLGVSVSGGLSYLLTDRWALTLDVRYLYARGFVTGISGINVGGVWFSLGVTLLFPSSAPKKDLDVPGFGSSNL